MESFLPKGYEVPKTPGLYMKLEQGDNKFRILSPAITGFEFWTAENKPVRVKEYPNTLPANIRPDSKIKHFWAFIVWNYKDSAVQILEITQATIQQMVNDLVISSEWGNPLGYDITIARKGEKLETEYTVRPSPHKEVAKDVKKKFEETDIKLDALFEGKDPAFDPKDVPFP